MDGLLINGLNAYETYGAMMGDGFLDTLLAPVPLKPFVQNKSRLMDGKDVVVVRDNIRKDSRTFTLIFNISGRSQEDYRAKKIAFYTALYNGALTISFAQPMHGSKPTDDVFHLIYDGTSVSFAQNIAQTACKITVKFEEPNPANRV